MHRRHFLTAATLFAAAGGSLPGHAQDAPKTGTQSAGFDFQSVVDLAQKRAAKDFVKPESELVGSFADLGYDTYRGIRFNKDMDPLGDNRKFAMDLLAPGTIFYEPVQINLVRDGLPAPVPFDPRMLNFDPSQFPDGADLETVGNMGWSGFRLRYALNRPDVMDEFLVFQGASYFRAVARGTLYGLSARGLALNTGSPKGEEFPLFTDFWIHLPAPDSDTIVIHAILDSVSVAGAFEFRASPGTETVIATRVALFPRVDIDGAGIAPLTSMFWFGPASRAGIDDYRPAVHDSDGLMMLTGSGQQVWRVLGSYPDLQISSFVDKNPAGFGLIQRSRDFDDFQDAEARYELRPSTWIEPLGDWGEGEVRLVEIPVENEFNDNIVSYWKPKRALVKGKRSDWSYRMIFAARPEASAPVAKVVATRSGISINRKSTRTVIVDFDLSPFASTDLPAWQVSASAGEIVHSYLQAIPRENVMRLSFEFDPQDAELADLRAVLEGDAGPLSEIWLARWCA